MTGFEIIEKVGISTKNYSDAVTNALSSVMKNKKVYWFEVIEQRGRITENHDIEYQIVLKIGIAE